MKQNSTSTLPFPFLASINERLKSPFPYYLNDDRKNLMVIAGLSAFVMAFMPLYKPYHNFIEHHTFADLCVFGGITFSVLTVSIIVFPKLFPVTFDPSNWTLQDHLVQTVLQCTAIGIVCVPVDKLYICPQHSLQTIAVHAFTQVALIGVIPATIITMFLKNMMLQQNLREAIRVNRELEKIRHMKKESVPGDKEITLYSDTSETLKLNLPDLLFIRADDNYSTVYWADNGVVQKKLLRANLKNIETQIDNAFTIRCHRSYVVNIHAITNITGNANGYKLRIKDSEHFIPVARPKGKEVMEKIGQLKNMMELY